MNDTKTKNKELANAMYEQVFAKKDLSSVEKFVHPEKYLQHDPRVSDGIEGKKKFLQTVKSYKPRRLLADGDLVVFHGHYEYNSGKNEIGFDIIRVENSKIVEHWSICEPEVFPGQQKDEVQKPAGVETMGLNLEVLSQLGGSCEIGDSSNTEATRRLAENFSRDILLNRQFDKLSMYLDDNNYTEHDFHIPYSGGNAIQKFIEITPFWKLNKIHKFVVDGNFFFNYGEGEVPTQIDDLIIKDALEKGGTIEGLLKEFEEQGKMKMGKYAMADLWRVENGKIVEHWDATFSVPKESKNSNGVF
jgi:predicted SnoaL-like aldol condensation-catalyzing enzyme